MEENVSMKNVEEKIIQIRNQQVILDCDVAELYGVQTKEVNQAVKNNPEKFPKGYVFVLDDTEQNELVKIFDRFNSQKHSSATMKAFTEKGLYMLATILKGPTAIQTTISIVETFAKLKELSRIIVEIPNEETNEQQKCLLVEEGDEEFLVVLRPENPLEAEIRQGVDEIGGV